VSRIGEDQVARQAGESEMNFARGLVFALAVLAATSGCKKTQPPPPAQPTAAEDRVAEVRRTLSQQSPGVIVVPVVEVLETGKLAAGRSATPSQFHSGDIVTFIDTRMEVVGTGRVIQMTSDQVHVRWEDPQAGQREPQVSGHVVDAERTEQTRG
jgi:hypothetical protein